ncbi:hypothetical protein SAMN00120144_3540 [Hymenobacter roseosalivarius DSM 11622]|uniref:Uncharacterized protein n=1 Tax=Hymenobacter roseosalivarius DSM 11622 TaxID=645990 RepID=A0A1W1VJY3_9BACT|nr:hypothetical protein [Hymenobacter roseosalivarius]SMB93371.1 hypothetical protein SAMN00120144_3540 [Hymenobacter roseosalivarius DSM 11622]
MDKIMDNARMIRVLRRQRREQGTGLFLLNKRFVSRISGGRQGQGVKYRGFLIVGVPGG